MNQDSDLGRSEISVNFVKKVVKECFKKGHVIYEALASHMVDVMMNHPNCVMDADETSPDSEDIMMGLCIKSLCESDSPTLLTMQLQTQLKSLSTKHKIVIDHRNAIQKLTQPLLSDLTDRDVNMSKRITLERDDIEALYHKLVITITLLSGLGNPTQKPILMSATVALSSVFPISEIARFLSLSKSDKMKQIEELAHIVAGIRIFNHYTHNHSEGIDDLPNILRPACTALKEAVLIEIEDNEKQLNLMDKVMNQAYMIQFRGEDDICELVGNFNASDGDIFSNVRFVKDFIITRRQMTICLRQLLKEVENSESSLEKFETELKQQIAELVEITCNKNSIPTDTVFPGFMELSTMWCVLQDQVILLNHYNNTLNFLRPFLKDCDEYKYINPIKRATIKSRVELVGSIESARIYNCQVIPFMDETTLPIIEFQSFCVFKILEGDGFLTPGDLSIGVLRYDSKYYAFSSCWAAYKFDKDPKMFIYNLMDVICRHPELIYFFGLQTEELRRIKKERLPSLSDGREDFEMQTVTIESSLDKTYTWNVWDMKREAIHLANIRKMQTHSTQTGPSNKKSSVGVQTYQLKDTSTQTRIEEATKMPTKFNFRFWLSDKKDVDEDILRKFLTSVDLQGLRASKYTNKTE